MSKIKRNILGEQEETYDSTRKGYHQDLAMANYKHKRLNELHFIL